jgi:hypothetical protein
VLVHAPPPPRAPAPAPHARKRHTHNHSRTQPPLAPGNIIGQTQTLTLFVESAYKEYNTEAAFAAAVLLSVLALGTLWVKDRVEKAAAAEAAK